MDLNELLGINPNDPLDALADRLVRADGELADSLRARRIALGLSIGDVSERMGMSTDAVVAVETGSLGTLRRYALAVGVLIEHTVTNVIEES